MLIEESSNRFGFSENRIDTLVSLSAVHWISVATGWSKVGRNYKQDPIEVLSELPKQREDSVSISVLLSFTSKVHREAILEVSHFLLYDWPEGNKA